MKSPAPKLFRSLPLESNLRMGSRFEPSQANGTPGFIPLGKAASPQRSATQTLVPSRSIPIALVAPQTRPCGSCAQFSIERYGSGSELVGATDWLKPAPADITITANMASAHARLGMAFL